MRHETKAVVGYALMEREAIAYVVVEPGFRTLSHHDFSKFNERSLFPPLRDAVDNFAEFVAGKPEVNEPLAVEQTRRLLQQCNPPSVVLDQVVIGGEDFSNLVLSFKGR